MKLIDFICMICNKKCLKRFNGLCKECQKEEITAYRGNKK